MNLREKFLPRDRRSIPAARHFTRDALTAWEWPEADSPVLCVSELATNALLHGVPPGRGLLLRLRCDGHVLRVEVHDSGTGEPRIPDATDIAATATAETGRGLRIVEALADKWGVGARDPGKTVWCEFTRSRTEPPHNPKSDVPSDSCPPS